MSCCINAAVAYPHTIEVVVEMELVNAFIWFTAYASECCSQNHYTDTAFH